MKISVLCIAVSAGVARLTRHFNLGGCFLCVGRALRVRRGSLCVS